MAPKPNRRRLILKQRQQNRRREPIRMFPRTINKEDPPPGNFHGPVSRQIKDMFAKGILTFSIHTDRIG